MVEHANLATQCSRLSRFIPLRIRGVNVSKGLVSIKWADHDEEELTSIVQSSPRSLVYVNISFHLSWHSGAARSELQTVERLVDHFYDDDLVSQSISQ